MKRYFACITLTLLSLMTMATGSFAATKPLSYPKGLAVDAKGNLYVANSGGNDILVYNANYGQITKSTITQGVINPSGVAFDPVGNLWVANYGTSNGGPNGSISEYTNGKQNTANSITDGILGPNAIAIDGVGNIWVQNDYINVTVYGQSYSFSAPTTLLKTLAPTYPIYGISVGQGTFAYGTNSAVNFTSETQVLLNGNYYGYYNPNDTGFALATDAKGDIYEGDLNGVVNFEAPNATDNPFLTLSFVPYGIAVDNARGRVYLSNYNGNSISVYSTSGTLLHVIQ